MTYGRVTVFGGSGFVGREIVKCLAAEGAHVRVAVRQPERTSLATESGGSVTAVGADVWEAASVDPAVAGAEAVINTVGHYVERGDATFEAIHGQGALNVARASARAGVKRLVHISGLGAGTASPSPYVRARGRGETLVVEALPTTTILRPSVIFGPEDAFLNRLAGLARGLPVIPLFGTGATRLQPVYVGDIAAAVAAVLKNPATEGKIFELGGPGIYSYKTLIKMVTRAIKRRRWLVPVPFFIWEFLAALMSLVPNAPLTRDQVTLMKDDNLVDAEALSLAELAVAPTPVETILRQMFAASPGSHRAP